MQLIGSDKQRAILGLGVTGLSCARYFAEQGLPFRIADSRRQPPGLAEFEDEFSDVQVELGPFGVDQFVDVDELYVSPGIPLSEPAIAAAAAAGSRISGDIDLFAAEARAPIAAITGSNGKSTVTTLVANMAKRSGIKVAVGGNLGTPALSLLNDDVELYVLELSSFQLERCQSLKAEVAVVLNVSEDHLDHHGSLVAYHQAKHRIFRGCRQAVINRDDQLTEPLLPESVKRWSFGSGAPDLEQFGLLDDAGQAFLARGSRPLMPVSELKIVGSHNVLNALAALAIGAALGLPESEMVDELEEFQGLPHRCQYLATLNDVSYYNDSKGTNVGAAISALRGVASGDRKVVLIAGGLNKGASLEPLIDSLLDCGRAGVFIGEAGPELNELLDNRLPSSLADSMQSAVHAAARLAQPGDAVLLSPACASFDMFDNYQHRGDEFQVAVYALSQGGAA